MNLEGQQLGEFAILERIGQGGMGAVYKASQTSLDRLVALKTLQGSLAEDDEFIGRFRHEARAAARLIHPNLVQVHAAGETDGLHWFAMEYVEGESAKTRLKKMGRLDPKEAIDIVVQVSSALEYGWKKAQLIHRDIKPDNIFLSTDGEVKLGDLGLAKSSGQTQDFTATGHSMGTPRYISPEQVQAMKTVDFRADIYSLGCTLYHFLCGRAPYEGHSAVTIMMQHVSSPVPDLCDAWPECPPDLAAIVLKMMLKRPEERQQSHGEVIAELKRVRDQLGQSAPQAVTAPRPQTVTPPQAQAATTSEGETMPRPQSVTPPKPQTVARSQPDAVTEPQFEAIAAPQAQPVTAPQAQAKTGPQPQAAATAGLSQARRDGASAPYREPVILPPRSGKRQFSFYAEIGAGLLILAALAYFLVSKLQFGSGATKDAPFVNSLGMKFVLVPIRSGPTAGQKVLFGIWDVRVQDYTAYAAANPQVDGTWKTQNKEGVPVGREADHPVTGVSWDDAQAFCQWLTAKEQAEDRLPKSVQYRLPSDEEWSWAVGLPAETGASPKDKHHGQTRDFPWGKDFPPANQAGNYADEIFHAKFDKNEWIAGYTDGYATTSPVGSYPANAYGLYDMGGNVWQWCEDWYDAAHKEHPLRGASWLNYDRGSLTSSTRALNVPSARSYDAGFRCVIGRAGR